MEKIFACKECGQVYHGTTPEKCMRHRCDSENFERIEKEDVINIHDVPEFLLNKVILFFEKLLG